jgi:hypothetical protein
MPVLNLSSEKLQALAVLKSRGVDVQPIIEKLTGKLGAGGSMGAGE